MIDDWNDRILNMTHNKVDTPLAPTITKVVWLIPIQLSQHIMKACFVYIYINLEMSEAVQETEGYPDHGFSACCSTSRSSNTSCLESGLIYKTRPVSPVSGPNGSLGLLTSTNTSYLFEQVVPGIMIAFYVSLFVVVGLWLPFMFLLFVVVALFLRRWT